MVMQTGIWRVMWDMREGGSIWGVTRCHCCPLPGCKQLHDKRIQNLGLKIHSFMNSWDGVLLLTLFHTFYKVWYLGYLFGTRGGSKAEGGSAWKMSWYEHPDCWAVDKKKRSECWRQCPSRCEWAGRVCGLWAFARDQPAVLFSSILSMLFPFNSSSPRLSPLCTCCRLPVPSGPKPNESLPDWEAVQWASC